MTEKKQEIKNNFTGYCIKIFMENDEVDEYLIRTIFKGFSKEFHNTNIFNHFNEEQVKSMVFSALYSVLIKKTHTFFKPVIEDVVNEAYNENK